MSTHETNVRAEIVEPGSNRSFGLTVGGILIAISTYQYLTGSELFFWFLLPGMLLLLLGLAAPKLLRPLNNAWTKLGILLGRIVTPVVMFLVYVVSIVPTGLLLRLFGKDLLNLSIGESKSTYWVERIPPGPPPESLKDQF